MRRAALQVAQADKATDNTAPGGGGRQPAEKAAGPGGFVGYGVAEKEGGAFALDKDVFWFAQQSKDRFKWNMLNPLPLLRKVR